MTAKGKALAVVEDPQVDTNSRRAAIRAQRHADREGIQARWNKRRSLQILGEALSAPRPQAPDVAAEILRLSEWAPIQELVGLVNIQFGLLNITSYLIRVLQLKEMPYDDYLQTPEWQKRAAQTKKRYGGKCALDERHDAVDAHHRTYERRGREYPDDLIPLCRECHSMFHGATETRRVR